jgi:cysteine synthase A
VIYAKCEQSNLTGSIKDRMALFILQTAYLKGRIRAGDTIAEANSGNTGIAFAAIGRGVGHPVKIFMPDGISQERKAIIRSFGAEIIPFGKEHNGVLGGNDLAERLARNQRNIFLPRQFSNAASITAHQMKTGPEIWSQLSEAGIRLRAFVAAVGTGGTIMGVGKYLRSKDASIKVYPAEPAESPTLSTGKKAGNHRIQGISEEFIPPILDFSQLDEVIAVHGGDAILMAQKLATSLGLGVGISSGCNFLAALIAQEKLDPAAPVVTVFADDNKRYLTTDLMKEEPINKAYLSPEIELIGLSTLRRDRPDPQDSELAT